MADILKGLFGGRKSASTPVPAGDDADFVDFAGAPSPAPASISPLTASTPSAAPAFPTGGGAVPYTAWYRVWERTSLNDFRQEMYILPFILVVILVHLWGTRANRRKSRAWITAHAPVLQQEFALIGYGGRKAPNPDDVSSMGLTKAMANDELVVPETLLREKAANEYTTYATGRQNIAFVDFKLSLVKRYNPLMRLGEAVFGMLFESLPAPEERMEAICYVFDGRENQLVPRLGDRKATPNSTYDGFVWAIVHKDLMKRLRDDRYDLSLTTTKDHPKLPDWATVMSESAEVTEILLTPELVKAVKEAGEALEALVVSDQPMDQPKKLDETVPKKRVSLSLRLPSSSSEYASTLPLFQYFLRMPDHLVSIGRFRPEAMRRVRQTREEEIRKIRRIDEEEKAEERKLKGDKEKKEKREALLKSMSAEEQRKYLEKEREKDMRRNQKRKTMKA